MDVPQSATTNHLPKIDTLGVNTIVPDKNKLPDAKLPDNVTHVTITQSLPVPPSSAVNSPNMIPSPQIIYLHGTSVPAIKLAASSSTGAVTNNTASRTLAPKPPGHVTPAMHRPNPLTHKTILIQRPSVLAPKPTVTVNVSGTGLPSPRPAIPKGKVKINDYPGILPGSKHAFAFLNTILNADGKIPVTISSQPPQLKIPTLPQRPRLVSHGGHIQGHVIPTVVTRKIHVGRPNQVTVGGNCGGMINLKISNGMIHTESQPAVSILREPTSVVSCASTVSQSNQFTIKTMSKKPNIIKSKGIHLPDTTLTAVGKVHINTDSETIVQKIPIEPITINKVPARKGSASLNKVKTNQDLNLCLQEAVDSLFSANSPSNSQNPDANEVTLVKVPVSSVKEEEPIKQIPEDDVHIELIQAKSVTDEIPTTSKTPLQNDSIDPLKVLDWKGDVGILPGSDLKFRMNEFGMMEMVDSDENDRNSVKSEPTTVLSKVIENNSVKVKDEETDVKLELGKGKPRNDDIYCCDACGCYGIASEFVTPQFCSDACTEDFKIKRDIQLKKDKEMLDLKDKRRKVRMDAIKKQKEVKKKARIAEIKLEATLDEVAAVGSECNESVGTTPSISDEDNLSNDGSQGTSKFRLPWQIGKSMFSWQVYLAYNKVKAAPVKLFKDAFPYAKNSFKVGMKMEGIDPEHQSLFCVLSVTDVQGFRIKLHFDGYGDNYDFWTNADSMDIFPPGWCEKNGRVLQPPRGYTQANFNWTNYLKQCKGQPSPKGLFYNKTSQNVCPNSFRLGMKLEAVDRQNTALVCVATVADLLDNRILVHFDGWDFIYDYWAEPTSSYIHPVGWCEENGHVLTPPNNFKGEKFNWEEYMKETKSTAAPSRAFKPRGPSGGFRKGMRLECVDRRMPAIVRVAMVDDIREHQIRIRFEGWSDIYSYWIDDDSRDIHPMTWCQKSGHKLEPPFTSDDILAECPTPECQGQGHVAESKHLLRHTVESCPYDPQNLISKVEVEDRLNSKPGKPIEQTVIGEKRPPEPTKNRPGRPPKWRTLMDNNTSTISFPEQKNRPGRPPKWKRLENGEKEASQDVDWLEENANREKRRQKKVLKQAAIAKRNFEYDQVRRELHQAVMNPGYESNAESCTPFLWAKHSNTLSTYLSAASTSDMRSWNEEQVLEFVSSIPGCQTMTEIFKYNQIDGEALSMISQQDLIKYMGFKLGPAIKLYNSVVLLRQNIESNGKVL